MVKTIVTAAMVAFAPTSLVASGRPLLRRAIDRLTRSQPRDTDREIVRYLKSNGFDHVTDSIEREIERRFLSRVN